MTDLSFAPVRTPHQPRFRSAILSALVLASLWSITICGFASPVSNHRILAPTPPMGWNDWAHYQCDFTANTILDNARALVKTGLAARGYNTVTIDDCWMQKDRDSHGNLQADPQRFPHGMKPIADAVHALGLKFGIYEDAGYMTCGGFAGSGVPKGGGADHFLQDAKLFRSWGVDYLKLDGCNVYNAKGESQEAAYRKAYKAESIALKNVGRPIVFSESAPAYFQSNPEWYDVLSWVRGYGQLWREGSDIAILDAKKPDDSRFSSVLWNYAYNLPLGRFQKPGNWNDADFIIGGDNGMSLAETRSQLTLWSMMSAPLILSSDLNKLTPQAIEILKNKNILAIDQDPLGRTATLVRRNATVDVLVKSLAGGDSAVAILNRGATSIHIDLHPADLGWSANTDCRLNTQDLWIGKHQSSVSALHADVAAHDVMIWRIHPASSCGARTRTGAITMITSQSDERIPIPTYSSCLSNHGSVRACAGTPDEVWTITADGALQSAGQCMVAEGNKLAMRPCAKAASQRWNYTLAGNLISRADGKCLSATGQKGSAQGLTMEACGHNLPTQIWSLPN